MRPPPYLPHAAAMPGGRAGVTAAVRPRPRISSGRRTRGFGGPLLGSGAQHRREENRRLPAPGEAVSPALGLLDQTLDSAVQRPPTLPEGDGFAEGGARHAANDVNPGAPGGSALPGSESKGVGS